MTGQPQPDRASSLPADKVYRLHATRLTQIAGRPRAVAPKRRARAALSLVTSKEPGQAGTGRDFNSAGDGDDRGAQRPSVTQEETQR